MAKYQDFLYSSFRITDELNCMIQSNGLKNGVFRRTRHLIQYIKTKAIRSSYFRNESDVKKEEVLKMIGTQKTFNKNYQGKFSSMNTDFGNISLTNNNKQ